MRGKVLTGGMICCLLFSSYTGAFAAYVDEIHAQVDEVWEVAQDVLAPYGIHKKKENKHFLETHWVEDEVVRRCGLIRFKKQHFLRRYRIRMKMKPEHYFVRVDVELKVEERPFASVRETNWRKVKPDYQEYALEKDTFMKVLRRIEDRRNQPASGS